MPVKASPIPALISSEGQHVSECTENPCYVTLDSGWSLLTWEFGLGLSPAKCKEYLGAWLMWYLSFSPFSKSNNRAVPNNRITLCFGAFCYLVPVL